MTLPKFHLGGALLCLTAASCTAQPAPKPFVAPAPDSFARAIYVDDDAAKGGDGSAAKPFMTIGAALKIAKPGDGVIVRAGTYREALKLPSGAPNQPITLMAAPGERAIVSGFAPIVGWKPFRDQIQVADTSFAPDGLFVRQTLLPMAQSPNEGWWSATDVQKGANFTVIDASQLKNVPADLSGAHAVFLQQTGNIIVSGPLASLDKNAGTMEVETGKLRLQGGDRYQLKNHPDLIDRPGEWAFAKSGDGFKVYFWPVNAEDLSATQARQGSGSLISGSGVSNFNIDGLEIVGSGGEGISLNKGASDFRITRCVVSGNSKQGILMRGVSNGTLARNIVVNNFVGVSILSAQNVVLEESEVAFNEMDGVVVAGDISGKYGNPGANPQDETRDVTLRRNYIHHHMLTGHPDNIQMYRGVKDVRLIENLAVSGGQTLMTEEVDGGELTGNVFVSSAANMILFGHGNSNDWTLKDNTFALPGYNVTSQTGKNYQARENVFYGAPGTLAATYRGESNLFDVQPLASKTGGQEVGARVQKAPLRNVPKSQGVAESLGDATRDSLLLRDAETFRVGDVVEINWDGIARTLLKVEAATGQRQGKPKQYTRVTFSPALPALPLRYVLVANWGKTDDINLNVNLAPEVGAKVGASLDVAAFMRGDFDNDGKRDLPDLPADVKDALPNPNALLSPMF